MKYYILGFLFSMLTVFGGVLASAENLRLHDGTATRIFGELKAHGVSFDLPAGNTSVELSYPISCDSQTCEITIPHCAGPVAQNCTRASVRLSSGASQALKAKKIQKGLLHLLCVEPEAEYVCQGSVRPL